MTKKKYRVHTFLESFLCGFEDLEDNTCEVFCDDTRMTYREVVDTLNKLNEEKETYKMLWEQMSYYFENGKELKDLDHKDFRALQRLAKGLVD